MTISMGFWLDAVQTVAIVLLGLYEVVAARSRATKSAIDRVDGKVEKLEERVIRVEERIPTDQKMAALYQRLGDLEKGISGLTARLESTDKLLQLLHRDRLRE